MNGQTGRVSVLALAVGLALAAPAQADVVISQVYGGGGNSGATLRNDFIELHNNGTEAVSLEGWSVQYASAGGSSWQRTNLSGSIAAGGYYLVQQAAGSGGTQSLPTPDANGAIAMAGASGKVALVKSQTALSGDCSAIRAGSADLVGYGSANCFEGTGSAAALGSISAALRLDGGCEDSGDNAADFAADGPTPRNSASASKVCPGGARTLNVANASIEEGADGTRELVFTVELTQPAGASGVRFDWATRDGSATGGDDYLAASGSVTIPAGETQARIVVAVLGDAREEQDETFELVISNIQRAAAGDAVATGTIVNDDFAITPISAIQGDGAASPLAGQVVAARGVVTGRKFNGFFVQSLPADADASDATSEGLFVFMRNAPADVQAGAVVTVRGTVTEFVPRQDPGQAPLTQLAGEVSVFTHGTASLPAPIELDATFPSPTGAVDQLERAEAMRVRVARMTVTAPTGGNTFERDAIGRSNGVFHGVVAGVPRPFREPGIQAPDAPPAGSIPPIPRWDFNPELLSVDSDALGAPVLDVAAGTELAELTGVLDYGFRRYTLLPDTAPAAGPAPAPHGVEASHADGFTVAAYNVERFFDENNDPDLGEPVLTAAAFERRLQKASLGIRDSLRTPDILGLIEVENLEVLQRLADRVNADAVAAGEPDPRYTAHLLDGNDFGGIDLGFLVKSANVAAGAPRVAVRSVEQIGKDTLWTTPEGEAQQLNDRPPLVLEANVQYADGRVFPVTVVLVHQRSLNGADESGPGGDRVRSKRQRQAEFLAAYLNGRQTRDPDARLVVLGDFNAFEFNDGLVDAMGVITGAPSLDEQTAVLGDGVDLVNPDLVNLGGLEPAHERYSFVFGGNAQTLDHVLVNEALIVATREITLDHARINADFPEINRNDATSPSRLADHDPVVATFYPRRRADLVLTAVSAGDARIGQTFAFDVVLRNEGPEQADRPGVGFELDAEVDGLQVTTPSGWNCDAPQVGNGRTAVTCVADALAFDGEAGFRLQATATAPLVGRTLSLTAAAEAESIDPQPDNNGARASLGITALADLRVALAGPAKHLRAGTRGVYRVAVGNAGPDAGIAPVLTLTGDVPARNLHFVDAAGWSCPIVDEAAGFRVTCTRTQLEVGAASSIDFSIVAPPRNGRDEIVVRARIASSGTDSQASNDTAVHAVRVNGSPK
ncbi:lamin tail domain-containing protein [Cognatilysobacter bugurensis]|uniref:Nuclease n=1 Tax=Cognatilysobacter bugurensis TaxID=543356 RepID=A0A918T480_9GAMM|nr:lamin tail domain-containing protein [Lysobacter bugurensis]GHA86054.1 nuclease [Lysobacter bugurensis]